MPSVESHGKGESGRQRGEPGKVFWGCGAGSVGRMGPDLARSCGCCCRRLCDSKFPRQLLGAVHHALCKVSRSALPALCSSFGDPCAAQGALVGAPPAAPLGDLVLMPWGLEAAIPLALHGCQGRDALCHSVYPLFFLPPTLPSWAAPGILWGRGG